MAQKNFTPIDDLVNKHTTHTASYGGHTKEAEPIAAAPKNHEIHKVVEHQVKDEVIKPYVQPRKEAIELVDEIKAIGATAPAHPKFAAYDAIKLPISDEKVVSGLKQPLNSSYRWLAEFSQYLLKMMHLRLKMVNGKITRVFAK